MRTRAMSIFFTSQARSIFGQLDDIQKYQMFQRLRFIALRLARRVLMTEGVSSLPVTQESHMSKRIQAALAVALAAAFSGAQAVPSIAAGESTIFFNNFENLYRPSASCVGIACLAADAGDPAGFRRVNSAVAGNVAPNDIFAGVLNVQNIQSTVSGSDTYNSNPGDRFTGYFAQRVVSVTPLVGTNALVTLGTAVDPFGILAPGEMFRLYANMPGFSSGGTIASSLASAVGPAANFWGSLGLVSVAGECGMLCGASDSYAYSVTDLAFPVATSATEAFLALDLMATGALYSAGTLGKLNDFNEDIIGGLGSPIQLCSAAQIAAPGLSCTDFVGTAEIESNSAFAAGTSPWQIASNDPLDLHRVPEPGTIALVGLALVAGGALRRRQAAK